jgi:hypothetical protein
MGRNLAGISSSGLFPAPIHFQECPSCRFLDFFRGKPLSGFIFRPSALRTNEDVSIPCEFLDRRVERRRREVGLNPDLELQRANLKLIGVGQFLFLVGPLTIDESAGSAVQVSKVKFAVSREKGAMTVADLGTGWPQMTL